MPTSDDFEAALDANPFDWDTRAVYADWLEENGLLPEAEGQRWMARNHKAPVRYNPLVDARNGHDLPHPWLWWHQDGAGWEAQPENRLNDRLFRLVDTNYYGHDGYAQGGRLWSYHLTRQHAEKCLIRGLATLHEHDATLEASHDHH